MAWKFKLVVLESLDQDSKPIEAINRKAKKSEQNDTTWVDGQEFSWKRFPKWPRKASLYFFFCFFALLQYFVPEKMDYALYCIHYIQEIVNPQGGKENHKGKMYNVRVCLKQKYSSKKVTKLTFFLVHWYFAVPEFYILQEKPKLPLPTQHKRKSEGLF